MKPRVVINGQEVPGIIKLIPGPEPLFGDGTGREAMDGHFSGVFVGYFTSLQIEFGIVSNAEYNLIKQLLEHPFLSGVQYTLEKDMENYKQGDLFVEDFYNGQVIQANLMPDGEHWEGFQVVLTAIDRRPQKS